MKPSVQARSSAVKAGWLVAGLLLGWLLFLFLPRPAEKEAPRPPPPPAPSTSLTRAGLPDYTDWVGLPEIFAIWADRAEWEDGKTRFAYWHPVMKNYSYYFEATRAAEGYRFREIPEPSEPDHFWDQSLGDECPVRFYYSIPVAVPLRTFPTPAHTSSDLGPDGVRVNITVPNDPAFVKRATPLDSKPKP